MPRALVLAAVAACLLGFTCSGQAVDDNPAAGALDKAGEAVKTGGYTAAKCLAGAGPACVIDAFTACKTPPADVEVAAWGSYADCLASAAEDCALGRGAQCVLSGVAAASGTYRNASGGAGIKKGVTDSCVRTWQCATIQRCQDAVHACVDAAVHQRPAPAPPPPDSESDRGPQN